MQDFNEEICKLVSQPAFPTIVLPSYEIPLAVTELL